MRILIVNPPHPDIGSRIPREQLPPLGLLCVGGALLDAGHDVTLLDAELGPLSYEDYVTPHRWTGYYRIASERRIIQPDKRKWDYKHQVLETRYMSPWRIFLWVKAIEIVLQARPKALWRAFMQPDRAARHGMNWFTRMGRRVIVHEFWNFIFHDSRIKDGPTLKEFWGTPQDHQEIPLRIPSSIEHIRPTQQANRRVRS